MGESRALIGQAGQPFEEWSKSFLRGGHRLIAREARVLQQLLGVFDLAKAQDARKPIMESRRAGIEHGP